uniref:DUF834 domain-containing protein n=1 Tax=Oryza punctata TaxID=4537 RepID=A0A0E0KQ16_ORYPU
MAGHQGSRGSVASPRSGPPRLDPAMRLASDGKDAMKPACDGETVGGEGGVGDGYGEGTGSSCDTGQVRQ